MILTINGESAIVSSIEDAERVVKLEHPNAVYDEFGETVLFWPDDATYQDDIHNIQAIATLDK